MKKRNRIKTVILLLIAALVLAVAASSIICSSSLKVADYEVPVAGLDSEIKIVCISDLHSREYGNGNEKLLAMITEQMPDAVFVDGDMIDCEATDRDIQKLVDLLEALLEIAPVYFSPGNHEVDYMRSNGEKLIEQISETGTAVVYDSYVETEIKGNIIRIGGTCGHYRDVNWEEELDYAMQEEIGSTDVPALVMLHMPESLVTDCAAERWTGDVYFCGHTHGGVIRIPGIGGLYAPTQGFFPEYDCGQFTAYGHDMIITSGLSGYKWLPRIFNRPEICVVTLTPEI